MEVRDMLIPDSERVPVVSVTQTPSLPSADHFVEATEHELFSFQEGTSATAELLIVLRPLYRGGESEVPPAGRGQGLAVQVQRLEVGVTREDDGRITVSCPRLDIASFGKTKSEASGKFLSALDDLRSFFRENKSTLSRPLLDKLQILESPLDIVEME
jgi:hypothetical protein